MTIGQKRSPDGGKRIAPAKIDPADKPSGTFPLGLSCKGFFKVGIHQTRPRDKLAAIFLLNPPLSQRPAFGVDEPLGNSGTILPWNPNAAPWVVAGPFFMKPTPPAKGRGQGHQFSLGCGKHRPNRFVQIVLHPGRFVDHQQTDPSNAANRFRPAGQRQHPRAVGKIESSKAPAADAEGIAKGLMTLHHLSEQFHGLPKRRGDDHHGPTRTNQGAMQGKCGHDGCLAHLA